MAYKKTFLALSFLTIMACKTHQESNLFSDIFTKRDYGKIYLQGKETIPCLIELIDIDKKSFVGMLDPMRSTIPSFIFENFRGIDAAYLIELILSADSLPPGSIPSDSTFNWIWKSKPYRIYNNCVIVRVNQNKPVLAPLDYTDVKAIKLIYMKWWETNNAKPINQLRNEWREGKHILYGSSYKWI